MIQPNQPNLITETQPAIERAHQHTLQQAAFHHLIILRWIDSQVVWVEPEELDPKPHYTDPPSSTLSCAPIQRATLAHNKEIQVHLDSIYSRYMLYTDRHVQEFIQVAL
ncbi:MAG: hypothetical protein RIG82_07255 [Phycisphaeraceae bacterium]